MAGSEKKGTGKGMNKTIYVREVSLKYVGDSVAVKTKDITTPEAVASLFRNVIDIDPRERFAVMHLNGRNQCTGFNIVSIGTLNASLVHPREVFHAAILASAAAIILCHNHPSGDLSPSKEDIALTKRLCEAGKLLGIKVVDHVIVTADGFASIMED